MKPGIACLPARRCVWLMVPTLLLGGNAIAQQADRGPDRGMDADKARVIEYWNQDRRQSARPRDLVIDPRGLGYLRQPNGALEPYGHQIAAEASGSPSPNARPAGGGNDSTPPSIANISPADGAVIGASATFAATVTDSGSGVRSVSFVITYPDGVTTQTFRANQGANDVWSTVLSGFTDGNWSWVIEAKDNAKQGGNRATEGPLSFAVDTGGNGSSGGSGGSSGGGSGGTSDTVSNAEWAGGGQVQMAAGRLYFEMPNNAKRKGPWLAYVCSGTVVADGVSGRSIVLTAAHCVYDDANKAFARNILFIPDQTDTTGSGTDTNCNNDPLGCWVPSFGVVDVEWTKRTFPDNVAWDYGYYVVDDSGAHAGTNANEQLDGAVTGLDLSFAPPYHDDSDPGKASIDFTHAFGYSYDADPNFMYCAEDMTTQGDADWWLPSCGLTGGSSGGPWLQTVDSGNDAIISVNSWGYTTSPGMAGTRLDLGASTASCVFSMATTANWSVGDNADGDAGSAIICPQS